MNRTHPLIEKSLTLPLSLQILFLVSVAAFLFALMMQFGFGVEPCVLCLLQRVPYVAVALASATALVWKPYGRRTTGLLALCALLFVANTGIAIFHSGVERHWWQGTASCAAEPLEGRTREDIRRTLLKTEGPRCDEISWAIFGLSMANFNIAGSLVLALFAAAAAERSARKIKK